MVTSPAPRKDPWRLVAPGWRWATGSDGRNTPPMIQKYDTSEPVKALFADPTASLPFDDKDWVYQAVALPNPPPLPAPARALEPYWPKSTKTDENGNPVYKQARRSKLTYLKTNLRKLFLDTHQRFYLVVVEAHCDVAGFPRIDPDGTICEAGFVIRRRRYQISDEALSDGKDLFKDFNVNKATLDRVKAFQDAVDADPTQTAAIQLANAQLMVDLAEAEDAFLKSKMALADWASVWGVTETLDGWVTTSGRQGHWTSVNPASPPLQAGKRLLAETTYPLYPLVPDPSDTDNAAVGRTVYFGLIPTGGDELEDASGATPGAPRFDDQSIYQIHCYIRRHKPECPFLDEPGDCPGELAWSLPTEKYRLANQQDLDGWANSPVTIQLPDLRSLEALALQGPIKGGMTTKAPPKSSIEVDVSPPFTLTPKPIPAGAVSCTFAIPLIDMVAMFVINIFMPIVVYLFSLWFLLMLKFCTPGLAEVSTALSAVLEDTFIPPVASDIEAEMGGSP